MSPGPEETFDGFADHATPTGVTQPKGLSCVYWPTVVSARGRSGPEPCCHTEPPVLMALPSTLYYAHSSHTPVIYSHGPDTEGTNLS